MEGATSKVLLQTPQKSVKRPTDSSRLWRTFFTYNQQARSPRSQTTGKNTVTGRFISFHHMDVLALNIHTSKGLFVAYTHRNPLTMRHKHNPTVKLNTQ